MQATEPRPIGWWLLLVLALAVGGVAGLGAVAFRWMIAGFHNLLFLGQFSFDYDANKHTEPMPWPWQPLVILVPVVGALGVAFLVKTFAPEAKGHGVPEVMDAIWYHDGRIRPVVAVVKSLASALSIGSGGSVGREGPIVQIGSAFGATVGQFIAMPGRQRSVLVSAGAGAGIAATFNTPIGGILFALELMLPAASPLSLLAVALAVVVATCIGRSPDFFGPDPAFNVPALIAAQAADVPVTALPWFLGFGVLVGLLAVAMVRGIYWSEDRFDALPGNYYTRHTLGMLLVGLILYGFMTLSNPLFGQPNHYYVQGVGYATMLDVLRGDLTMPGFLLLLVVAKLAVTCLTLGSGASGGVFSPSLFLGATLGGCCGAVLNRVIPGFNVPPAYFALAGMAGMVGGTTGATLTGIVMVFEMTRDYRVILPVILVSGVAVLVRQGLCPPTIYTLKLLRRGHVVPQGVQAWIEGARRAQDIMSPAFTTATEASAAGGVVILVSGENQIRGVVDPAGADPKQPAAYVAVEPQDRLNDVLRALEESGARVALVLRTRGSTAASDVLGVITDREIAGVTRATAKVLE